MYCFWILLQTRNPETTSGHRTARVDQVEHDFVTDDPRTGNNTFARDFKRLRTHSHFLSNEESEFVITWQTHVRYNTIVCVTYQENRNE